MGSTTSGISYSLAAPNFPLYKTHSDLHPGTKEAYYRSAIKCFPARNFHTSILQTGEEWGYKVCATARILHW
jgi:hypothetical protein